MAQQIINIGSSELSGDGESLRSAFQKVNSNFTELYNAPSPSPSPPPVQDITTSSLTAGSYKLEITDTGTVTLGNIGNIQANGNLVIQNNVGSVIELLDNIIAIFGATQSLYSGNIEGGEVYIQGGNGFNSGGGGIVSVSAGAGGTGNNFPGGPGGNLELRAGVGAQSNSIAEQPAGDGGTILLRAGAAGFDEGDTTLGATGGNVNIIAGRSNGDNIPGGNVSITSGQGQGSNAYAGSISLTIPTSTLGSRGTWIFQGDGKTLQTPNSPIIVGSGIQIKSTATSLQLRATSVGNVDYDWFFDTSGTLITPGHIIPSVDAAYDLGSTSSQWRSLYVGTSTVYFGGIPLRVTQEGGIIVNDVPVSGGNANTGDITFNGVKIIGAGTASGDGLGYSTLELVPDGTLQSDQYIVVDPTAPNHIHLRAGGTQDSSTAALFLGGELNYARVTDGYGVRLNNAQFIPDTAYFEQGTDYDSATWSTDESGNHWIDIRISDPLNPTRDPNPINTAGSRFTQYPTRNSIEVFTGSSLFTVNGNSQAYTLGNPYEYRIGTVEAPPANPTTLASLDYRLNTFNERYLYLENNALEAYADTVNVFSGQTIDLVTGTGNIRITTDDNNSSYSWYFTAQGYLQFPQGLAPTTSKGKEGDEAGSVVVDADYIYYCHTDYTDGIADIWKRVAWSGDTW